MSMPWQIVPAPAENTAMLQIQVRTQEPGGAYVNTASGFVTVTRVADGAMIDNERPFVYQFGSDGYYRAIVSYTLLEEDVEYQWDITMTDVGGNRFRGRFRSFGMLPNPLVPSDA
jgi:hypothetical protein